MPFAVQPRTNGSIVSSKWASKSFTDPRAKDEEWQAAPSAQLITNQAPASVARGGGLSALESRELPKLANKLSANVAAQPVPRPQFPQRPLPHEAALVSMKRGKKQSDNIRFRLDG